MRAHRQGWITALVLLVAWEIAGRLELVAQGALPAPSAILLRFWADKADYGPHVLATIHAAFMGFVIGNVVAVLAALLFVLLPVTERLARGVNVTLFALPPIAIVPILVIAFSGETPRIVLAAMSVYFPTMAAMVVGLTQIDPRSVDLVCAYGGGKLALLRLVRLRSSLPALLIGLRVAAPNAVLGAILAEFGGGGRYGLGVYLLGSLGRADPARLWGIGLTATAIAGLAYGAVALLARHYVKGTRAVTTAVGALPEEPAGGERHWRLLVSLVAFLLPFALWWLVIALLGANPIVARTPWGVLQYLAVGQSAVRAWHQLLPAIAQTLPLTFLGMAAGLAVALALAILGRVWPAVARTFLPIALVTQTMPLVALTPLLVLLLGRGVAVTVAITVSVTFFPAFVTIAQGLELVPRAAFDLVQAYGAGWIKRLRLVGLPSATPYLFAAARLAVPRALLGAMIAEWLATGMGLGNLLNQARGYLDYGLIWSVAVVSVAVSVLFYDIVTRIERRVLARMGMAGR